MRTLTLGEEVSGSGRSHASLIRLVSDCFLSGCGTIGPLSSTAVGARDPT